MAHTITIVENDLKSFQIPMETEMDKSIKHLEGELIKVRTGRANTVLIENIMVSIYGQAPAPLRTIAALSAPESTLLVIQPWDVSIINEIEKAIQQSDLGASPINDGKIIRIQLPKASGERREELLKVLGKKVEECKIAIRNVRKDFNNYLRDAKKDKVISENFFNRLSDVLQDVTDKFCKKADDLGKKKETELKSV